MIYYVHEASVNLWMIWSCYQVSRVEVDCGDESCSDSSGDGFHDNVTDDVDLQYVKVIKHRPFSR
jgi:hypothetical protein